MAGAHDAERAVRAGLAIVEAAPKLETAAGEPLHVRVGIATGIVVVGDLLGSGEAQERGVVGDTPNLAARLGDTRLSHPHRHRQSVARARSRAWRRTRRSPCGPPVSHDGADAKAAIEVRSLTKRFGRVAAVEGVHLDCAPGEVFGFVGPDGAGKTTIMRLLAAVMAPDEGSMAIKSRNGACQMPP